MIRFILVICLVLLPLSHAAAAETEELVEMRINGLVCDFCARSIFKLFEEREDVQKLDINLSTKIVSVHFTERDALSDTEIREIVQDAGYEVASIERKPGAGIDK